MTVEVKGIEISEEVIKIEAIQLEFLFKDDLFEDAEALPAVYEFERKTNNGAHMKYLWKLVSSQKCCKNCKSFGEKLEKLVGQIIFISENFKTM